MFDYRPVTKFHSAPLMFLNSSIMSLNVSVKTSKSAESDSSDLWSLRTAETHSSLVEKVELDPWGGLTPSGRMVGPCYLL